MTLVCIELYLKIAFKKIKISFYKKFNMVNLFTNTVNNLLLY